MNEAANGAASEAVPLVEVWRGPFLESRHRGHAVVCDAGGSIRAAWGDPEAVILPRSSVKMLQALPLVESRAGATLSDRQLALACASHSGAAMHVEVASAWLAALGLGERDLRCGPQWPQDRAQRTRLRQAGAPPTQLHNTCSGKHAGYLMLGAELRAGPEYVAPDHPVQNAVRDAIEAMSGVRSPGFGIDGCCAPNFATTMRGLALAMARMADPSRIGATRAAAARRLVGAMLAHPLLVAGEGLACSELMAAAGGKAAVKFGAEGVYAAILPQDGLGVALKIEDGNPRASECAIAALLVRLGALDADHPATLRRMACPIHDRREGLVGEIRPDADFYASGDRL